MFSRGEECKAKQVILWDPHPDSRTAISPHCACFPFIRVLFPCNSSGMPRRCMQGTFKTSFWATWNIKGFYWSGESPGNRLHWATYWRCVPFTFMKKKVHISIVFVHKHLPQLNHLFQYAWLKPTLIRERITSHCLNRHVGLVTPFWRLCEKAFYPLAYPKYKPSIYWVSVQSTEASYFACTLFTLGGG